MSACVFVHSKSRQGDSMRCRVCLFLCVVWHCAIHLARAFFRWTQGSFLKHPASNFIKSSYLWFFFPPQSLKAIFASGIRLEFLSHKNHHCKQPKSFLKAMTEKKSVYFSWKFCLWDSSIYSYCFRDDTGSVGAQFSVKRQCGKYRTVFYHQLLN